MTSAQELNKCEEETNEKPYDMNEVKGGDVFQVDKSHSVRVIECTHTVPTVGYLFYEIRQKLKAEYQGVSGNSATFLEESFTQSFQEKKLVNSENKAQLLRRILKYRSLRFWGTQPTKYLSHLPNCLNTL